MLKIRRLGYALGAEVSGLDLSATLNEETVSEIRDAWLKHLVLCFPGQDLSPEQQAAFAGRLGEIEVELKALGNLDVPGISLVANKAFKVGSQTILPVPADDWHSDLSFTDHPATGTFLLAKELPAAGGNTMFANAYRAYETLSEGLRRVVDSLEAVHDVQLSISFPSCSPEMQAARVLKYPLVVHPVARTHPETGRKALFVGATLRNFLGMTEEETRPIRDTLMEHATRYEVTYRHSWTVGDLLLWDNRCTMHYAVPDYEPGEWRKLQRCTLLAPRSGYFLSSKEASDHASVRA